MSSDSICRTCLCVDAHSNMLSLIPVQDMYEKVTNNRLHNSKMPVAVCYICYAQLKRCYRFMLKSMIADDTLIELLQTKSDITPELVSIINRKARSLENSLTVTPVRHENLPFKPEIPIVKTEPMKQEEIEIKAEADEDTAVSDAEDCIDDSLANFPIKIERNEDPGSSNAANIFIPEECDSQTVSLEVNVEVKEEPTEGLNKKSEETDAETKNELLKIRPKKSYECTICQRRFNQNSQLTNHLRVHTGEKPFSCIICDSKFTQRSSLKRHLQSHTGEKPFECNICERRFIQASELRKHLRTHSGEKPYKCQVCEKSFSLNKHLTSHMRSHTGEKPFGCHLCDAKYRERSHLKRHLSMHSGEKPFECNVCGVRFRRKCNLKTHLMIHSGERRHVCKICKQAFIRSSHLKLHMLTHKKHTNSELNVKADATNM